MGSPYIAKVIFTQDLGYPFPPVTTQDMGIEVAEKPNTQNIAGALEALFWELIHAGCNLHHDVEVEALVALPGGDLLQYRRGPQAKYPGFAAQMWHVVSFA